jgi:hypothetical protein
MRYSDIEVRVPVVINVLIRSGGAVIATTVVISLARKIGVRKVWNMSKVKISYT